MNRARPNVKSGKLIKMFPDFSGGLNTSAALHQVKDTEFVEGTNVDINEQGAASKRKGFSQIVATLGTGKIQGSYVFKKYTTKELLVVHNGKLYRFNSTNPLSLLGQGSWVEIPIRRHLVQNLVTAIDATGTVGANILANITYIYSVVAKDAAGATIESNAMSAASGATAHPITLTWDKSYGATNYDVYRATGSGARKLIKADVGDVATWKDTGADAPTATDTPTFNTTKVTIPLTNNVSFVNHNDTCFFATGVGLCVYDGVTASIITPYTPTPVETTNIGLNSIRTTTSSIHKCTQIKLHVERLFVAGDPDFPQNFYWTDLNLSPGYPKVYFPVLYGADVTTANGSPVTGMCAFRENLIFFTTDSIHALFGKQPDETKPDFFILRPIHPEIGTLSSRSIVLVGNVLVFVSRDGIYALTNVISSNQYLNVQYLSEAIAPTLKNLTRPDVAIAIFHDQQYKVCFPEDGIVLRWYAQKQAWTLDTAPKVNGYFLWDSDLYMTSYTNGIVWKFGVKRVQIATVWHELDCYNDDGAIIPFYFRTKSFDMDAMVNQKKFRKAFVAAKQYAESTSITMVGTIDYVSHSYTLSFNESAVLGTWTLGTSRLGWVDVIQLPVRFKGKGHQAYFKFTNEILDEPVTIYGLGVEYKVKTA